MSRKPRVSTRGFARTPRHHSSKPRVDASASETAGSHSLNLPSRYDPRYKVNSAILTAPKPELERVARNERLPVAAVDEYRSMLAHYEDFHQRRALAKLVKLAKDKSKLPIAAELDAIVDAVTGSPGDVDRGRHGVREEHAGSAISPPSR